MDKNKKKIIWFVGGASALLLLLLVLPKLINLAPIKQKILANVSRTVGGDVVCQQIDLSLFPRPYVKIYQGRLSIPEKITGNVRSLEVYLKIWPLFKGQFRFSHIRVEAPDFKIDFPEQLEKREDTREQIPFEVMIKETLAPISASLRTITSDPL